MQNEFTGSRISRRLGARAVCLAALAGLSFVMVSGPRPSDAAPSHEARAGAPGKSTYDKDHYRVQLKPSGKCSVGKDCKVEVLLESKGPYHINDKYPIKFKAGSPPSGVTFTKATVTKPDGRFEEKKGSLPVGFTVAKAGKVNIAGTFYFSVCTDANCLMEKLELELDVDVK